jgi:site-specific DNA-cytosine methylase
MNVLSLFDGISCAMMALQRANIPIKKYYASEIDKFAIQVSKANHPQIEHLGNVKEVKPIADIDLLIGGSPCQDLSIAKQGRKGLEGNRSSLFWEYVRLLRDCKPKYFVLENVASMPNKDKQIITDTLGVEPICINASLVSAQHRKRLFWTNIPNVKQPADRGIILQHILEPDTITDKDMMTRDGKSFCLLANYYKGNTEEHTKKYKTRTQVIETTEKTIRKLTPIECERLQGLPDNYTNHISNTQRYKCLGNAFNVDVVAHILSHLELV